MKLIENIIIGLAVGVIMLVEFIENLWNDLKE